MNRQILSAARKFADRVAVVEGSKQFTYSDIAARSLTAKNALADLGVRKGDRISLFGEKTADYVAVNLGAWRLGATVITLLPDYPVTELEYYVQDSASKLLISSDLKKAGDVARAVSSTNVILQSPRQLLEASSKNSSVDPFDASSDAHLSDDDTASFIYTSGSTSKPKGVVTTHGALKAMVNGMISAWAWTENDRILHFLPLHHVHGAINKLLTPLSIGAQVEFVDFDLKNILTRLNSPDDKHRPTVFMGVPTVYAKLVEEWEKEGKPPLGNLQKLRLFVCGSAPLPVHLFEKFSSMAKQPILERWGMTEVGMGLSNPLNPPEKRIPGYVGLPMPGIEVKIVDLDADGTGSTLVPADHPGDLLIKGKSVFKTYWGKAAHLTASEFTPDGYFKTGDVAVYDSKVNSYKIVGRKSVDIIKSGGFKISAIEIERTLLENNDYQEVVVLGVPDETWGETVAAIVVPKTHAKSRTTVQSVTDFGSQRLAKYKIPRKLLIMDAVPKNAMGKVNKKSLKSLFQNK